jgi:8-oxo-dGTP pyrophosphatase MutT (NUDIX family)
MPCAICKHEGHDYKKCPEFAKLKKKVSPFDYVALAENCIFEEDLAGFCSAGFLLINKKHEFLAINEKRNGVNLWNLIGGKREDFSETPIDTAVRELSEEAWNSPSLLPMQITAIRKYIWISSSKYFLIVAEVDRDPLVIPPFKDKMLRWFSLASYDLSLFHPFAVKMLTSFETMK